MSSPITETQTSLANGIATPPQATAAAAIPRQSPAVGVAATYGSATDGLQSGANGLDESLFTQRAGPSTSLSDTGKSTRPRDARLIHLVLASLGVSAYQERVPLQLLDFAYRYTAGVLGDALHLTLEGHAGAGAGASSSSSRGNNAESVVSIAALRLAVAGRLNYQFRSALPKEFLLELAQERNRIALPRVEREFGLRLPPEKYCLTGVGWGLKDNWDSEGEEDDEVEEDERGGGLALVLDQSRSEEQASAVDDQGDTAMADGGDGDAHLGDQEDEEAEFEDAMGTQVDSSMAEK